MLQISDHIHIDIIEATFDNEIKPWQSANVDLILKMCIIFCRTEGGEGRSLWKISK